MDEGTLSMWKGVLDDFKNIPSTMWIIGSLLVWVFHQEGGYLLLIFGTIIACMSLAIKFGIRKHVQ